MACIKGSFWKGALLCFLLCVESGAAFGLDGVLHGSSHLKVLKTEYFDIVYAEDSVESARAIARVGDAFYKEITARLGVEMKCRFPVTITKQVEQYNAYFSVYPYNRIVLYDTKIAKDMDMDERSLENTFYHELTHAITGNIRRGVVKGLSALLGDWVSPTFFFSTAFWTEGTAVEYESHGGSGRLTDPYSTQMVVQAKIEDKFPSWREVSGARDIYPGGTDAYMFGGLFGRYLCETYGADQYAAWWRRKGYGKRKVPDDELMKALSGKNMKETWAAFKEWIPVPAHTADFSGKSGVADFFEKAGLSTLEKNGFSKLNNGKRVYASIDATGGGVVWYEKKTATVWFSSYDEETTSYAKPRKLLCASGVSRLSLSEDGSLVAVSYLRTQENTKSRLALVSTRTGAVTALPWESVADGALVSAKDGVHLLMVDFSNGYTLKEYGFEKGEISKKNIRLIRSISLGKGEIPFSPVDCGDGRAACIIKNGLSWKIRLYDTDGTYRDYGTSKTIIHNLHARTLKNGTIAFSFSYVELGDVGSMLPRGGMLYVSPWDYDSLLVLQKDDISAGILDMAFLPHGAVRDSERLVYVAGFYDTSRLISLDFESREVLRHQGTAPRSYRYSQNGIGTRGGAGTAGGLMGGGAGIASGLASGGAAKTGADLQKGAGLQTGADLSGEIGANPASGFPAGGADSLSYKESSYNPLAYYVKGALFPIASVSPHQSDFTAVSDNLLGLTWRTANPWGDHSLTLSGGYQYKKKYGTAMAEFSGGNNIWSYTFSGDITFNKDGFVQTMESANLARILYSQFGKSVQAGVTGNYFYGKGMQYLTYIDFEGREKEDLFYDTKVSDSQSFSGYLLFSTIRKQLPGYFQYGGVSFKPFLLYEHTGKDWVNAGVTVTVCTPWIIPLTASASLFPRENYFASGKISAILWSHEIQHAVPLFYFKRIYVRPSYAAKLAYDSESHFDIQRTGEIAKNLTMDDYSDSADLFLGLHSSINWGFLSYTTIDGGAFVRYKFHPEPGKKKLSWGVSAQLVY